jgi:hypothetical protein
VTAITATLSGNSGPGICERWRRNFRSSIHSKLIRPAGVPGRSTCSVQSPTSACRRASALARTDAVSSIVSFLSVSRSGGVRRTQRRAGEDSGHGDGGHGGKEAVAGSC